MKTWIYQRKEIKVLYFSINAVFQARSQKSMHKKNYGSTNKAKYKFSPLLWTQFPRWEDKKKAENKFLPLHYQPNFQARRQKNVHKKKVYQQNDIKVFYFTINPVSKPADKKFNKYSITYTFEPTTFPTISYQTHRLTQVYISRMVFNKNISRKCS